jgi:two-component system sensor histidine kinase MprB
MSRFTPAPNGPPPTADHDPAVPTPQRGRQGRRPRTPGWYRRVSLRGRLSLLTAAAVAVAIAASAFACWFLVRGQLYNQVNSDLASAPGEGPFSHPGRASELVCAATVPTAVAAATLTDDRPPNRFDMQVVTADGTRVCLQTGPSPKGIVVEPSDLQARPAGPGNSVYRDGSYLDGTPARIRVIRIDDDIVVLTAVSLANVERSLQGLVVVLSAVAAVGVLGAAAVGLIVARAALRPVHRLTGVVEHIARTEEVGATIPVAGKDEIARLSQSFNAMSTALANSRERQTRLIADAGHELRTPLTSLRTNVDLLVRSDETGRPLPPETRTRMLANMKAQMIELSTLIGDLLELSRPSRSRSGREIGVVALHEIAARAVERGRLRGPGLSFDVRLGPWYVRGDAHALERAMINLLDNAVKYSPAGGSVDVALTEGRLTVRDRGPGIAPEELPYVFDRFWRSPSSRALPGSGLGLSIVAQTVRDSGGEVTLGTAADGSPGTVATVRLPGAATPPPAGPVRFRPDPPGGAGAEP